MRIFLLHVLLLALLDASWVESWSPHARLTVKPSSRANFWPTAISSTRQHEVVDLSRRRWFCQMLASFVCLNGAHIPVARADDVSATSSVPQISFKEISDSLFTIRVPNSYFAIRRSAKGDLPDSNTGQGRRGATIFTGGDLQKAELVAIERYPVRVLLADNGIDAGGKLDTFPAIAEPQAIAKLISLYRERERSGGGSSTELVPGSITVSDDGKDLNFQLKTELEVQKPELLMEQYGVSKLIRITVVKATLRSNDGNLMAAFGSALEKDFNGPDGALLTDAIRSFQAKDQSVL